MSEDFPFKYSHGGFYYIEDDGLLDEAKKRWAAYPKMVEWINRRKNKIHPTDPIHEILKVVDL